MIILINGEELTRTDVGGRGEGGAAEAEVSVSDLDQQEAQPGGAESAREEGLPEAGNLDAGGDAQVHRLHQTQRGEVRQRGQPQRLLRTCPLISHLSIQILFDRAFQAPAQNLMRKFRDKQTVSPKSVGLLEPALNRPLFSCVSGE